MKRQAFLPPDDDDVIDMLTGPLPTKAAPAPVPPIRAAEPIGASRVKPAAAPKERTKAERPAEAGRIRRVGLYLSVDQWARLNEVSIDRGRRGQSTDYTSIVLEALKAKYGI